MTVPETRASLPESLFRWLSPVHALATSSVVLALALLASPFADDYWRLEAIRESGILKVAWSLYTHWDGRLVLLAISDPFFTSLGGVTVLRVVGAAAFLVLAAVMMQLARAEVSSGRHRGELWVGAPVVASALFLGMGSMLGPTVFWATGCGYVLADLAAVAWCSLVLSVAVRPRRIGMAGPTTAQLLVAAGASIVCGAMSQNLSPALLVFCCGLASRLWVEGSLTAGRKRFLTIVAACIAVGSLVMVLSPAALVRAGHPPLPGTLRSLIGHDVRVVKHYIQWSYWAWALSLVLGFVWASLNRRDPVSRDGSLKRSFVRGLVWVCTGASSLPPMLLVPRLASQRTAIFFLTFTSLGLLILSRGAFEYALSRRRSAELPFLGWLCAGVSLTMLLLVLGSGAHNIRQAWAMKSELRAREQVLTAASAGSSTVEVNVLQAPVPRVYVFSDITEDEKDWRNQAVAAFYGLKGVGLKNLSQLEPEPGSTAARQGTQD